MARSTRKPVGIGGIGVALAAGLAASAAVDCTVRAQVYGITRPDIINKTLILRPDTVPAGGVVEITSAVQNKGTAALTPRYRPKPPPVGTDAGNESPGQPAASPPPTLVIRFVLVTNVKDADGIPAGEWGLDALEQREIERNTVLWTVPAEVAPGTYYVCADVDPDKTVRESNDLNNRTCQRLTVTPALGPETEGEDPADVAAPTDAAPAEEKNGAFGLSGLDGTGEGEKEPY